MVGKAGFALRSLFIALTLGSLVACTFEGSFDGKKMTKSGLEKSADDDADDAEDAEERTGDDTLLIADGGGADVTVGSDGGWYPHGGDGGWSSSDSGTWPRADGGTYHYDGGWSIDSGAHADATVDSGAWHDAAF